jgi:hypothetical protein
VWISWHDLVGAGILIVDGALMFTFMTLGDASIEQQLTYVFLIRVARFFRLASYWAKVSSFHYLRAMAFKSRRGNTLEDDEDVNNYDTAGHNKTSSFASGAGGVSGAAHRVFLRMSMRGSRQSSGVDDASSIGGASTIMDRRRSKRSGPRAAVLSSKHSMAQIWQRQPGYIPSDNPWVDFRRPQNEALDLDAEEDHSFNNNNNNNGWQQSEPDLELDDF